MDTTPSDQTIQSARGRDLRRAYGALLGNFYEGMYHQHMQLSAATSAFASDYPSALTWQRAAVAQAAQTVPLQPFLPCLITDEGSAFLDPDHFVLSQWSEKFSFETASGISMRNSGQANGGRWSATPRGPTRRP